jgi:terminase small subunit-like protein
MPDRLTPPYDDDERRGIWHDVIGRLRRDDEGGIFRANADLIGAYVEAVASHNQACRIRAQTNVMITRGDRAVENPALAIQRRTAADIASLGHRLGLDRSPMVATLAESPMVELRKWCDEHARWECSKHRSDGMPCHQRAVIPGTGACYKHVGMSREKAREKGRVQLLRVYGQARPEVDPIGGLLEEVSRSAGHVAALERLVASIEEAEPGDGQAGSGGLWHGVVRETRGDDGSVVQERRAAQHVVLQAYNAEREHFVRACLAAKTAGAHESAVDAARALGANVGRLFDAIFAALLLVPPDLGEGAPAAELVAWQRAQVPRVVPAILREYTPVAAS